MLRTTVNTTHRHTLSPPLYPRAICSISSVVKFFFATFHTLLLSSATIFLLIFSAIPLVKLYRQLVFDYCVAQSNYHFIRFLRRSIAPLFLLFAIFFFLPMAWCFSACGFSHNHFSSLCRFFVPGGILFPRYLCLMYVCLIDVVCLSAIAFASVSFSFLSLS